MQEKLPVLIVGAGPTGLTAAMELARLGVPVRLVDKVPAFSTTSRALAVQARTMELMEQRGLAGEMVRLGNRGNAATLYSNGRTLGRLNLNLIESRFNYILLLAQSETERILREQLQRQKVAVELETEMIAFAQGSEGGRAVLRHGDGRLEEVACRFLIAAEGAHSTLRRSLALDFKGVSLPQSYALADVHIDCDLPQDELSIFLPENGLMAVFPMGAGRFRVIATDPESGAQAPDPDLATMQRLYDERSQRPGRLHDMVWSSHFHINSRMLDRLAEGHVFFGGDAAHIHSPAGGQGMNTGIQDMINLAWKMALVYHGRAPAELLDSYAAERLPVIRAVVTRTERATDALNAASPLVHSLLTHLASAALRAQFTQHMGTGVISELEWNYRESPLSEEHGRLGTLRAGDRVPDLPVRAGAGAAKRETRLLSLLTPSDFTLLVLREDGAAEDETATTAGVTTLILSAATDGAEDAEILSRTFGEATLVLVRPDGYAAFLGGEAHRAQLARWLARWLPVRAA